MYRLAVDSLISNAIGHKIYANLAIYQPFLPSLLMSSKPVIVVPDYLTECAIEREIYGPEATIRLLGATDECQILDAVEDADVVLLYHDIVLREPLLEQKLDWRPLLYEHYGSQRLKAKLMISIRLNEV